MTEKMTLAKGGHDDVVHVKLGAFELLLMLALVDTRPNAYGITIQCAAERRARHRVSLGAVYTTLDRLENKELVWSWRGQPSPERGGRSKRFFDLTPRGERSLERSVEQLTLPAASLSPANA